MIAHALAIIRNRVFGGALNPGRTAVRALYHDASEVLTGDLPAAVENLSPKIKTQVPGGDWGRESRVREVENALRASLDALALPEVGYFLDTFDPSFRLTLDATRMSGSLPMYQSR